MLLCSLKSWSQLLLKVVLASLWTGWLLFGGPSCSLLLSCLISAVVVCISVCALMKRAKKPSKRVNLLIGWWLFLGLANFGPEAYVFSFFYGVTMVWLCGCWLWSVDSIQTQEPRNTYTLSLSVMGSLSQPAGHKAALSGSVNAPSSLFVCEYACIHLACLCVFGCVSPTIWAPADCL